MQYGYVMARVYTSDAEIPIENAVLTVLKNDANTNTILGARRTDKSGKTDVVPIEAPDMQLSEKPGDPAPFTEVTLRIDHPDYYTYFVTGAQVFANQVSLQQTPMIPLKDAAPAEARADSFYVTPQNL